MTMSDAMRQAMDDSDDTLYRISKDSGLSYAVVHRFYTGRRGLTLETADQLADYLGLELKPKNGRRGKPKRRKPATK
jgi:hypothetical protein